MRTQARALASPPLAVREARAGSLEGTGAGPRRVGGRDGSLRVRRRTTACALGKALVGSLRAPQPEAVQAVVRVSLFARCGVSRGGRCGTTNRTGPSSCST